MKTWLTMRPEALLEVTIEKAKEFFLDSRKILDAVKRAKVVALTRPAGAIRLTARRSIRRKKGASEPGHPPHSHGEDLLRNNIFYLLEPSKSAPEWVRVGAARLNKPGLAPRTLEFGGEAPASRMVNRSRLKHGKEPLEAVRIEPRPYMRPALERNIDKIPEAWRNTVVIR